MIRTRTKRPAGGRKALALGLLLAASLLLTARPAHASTTFTVNSDTDTDDGTCDATNCTLREAINAANAAAGADTIRFAIPDNPFIPGLKVKTISPSSPLPEITDTVTIDGYTQPGASENTQAVGGSNAVLKVELNGINGGGGLIIRNTSNVVIKGLVINRFVGPGIDIASGSGKGNRVEGNFIGTDPGGTQDLGNGHDGVALASGDKNTIGGSTPEARNLISGNGGEAGVAFSAGGFSGAKIQGNLIGTGKDGTSPLGNDGGGVLIRSNDRNTIGSNEAGAANVIAFNGRDGVAVLFGGTGNRILSNSIFSNGGLGIDLDGDGPTANDPKDPDKGSNALQNFPDLASATTSSGTTTIEGTLESTPRKRFTIQFFRNPSGGDEGKTFIGEKKVKTNREGRASFTFGTTQAVSAGEAITATATNSGGNTSEFSDPREVVQF